MTEIQTEMFGAIPQPRSRDPESWTVWFAVLKLRRHGHHVYRAGRRGHLIDGQFICSTKRLMAKASSILGDST